MPQRDTPNFSRCVLPFMARATYGPKVKERAEFLFKTLLQCANYEIAECDPISLRCKWEPRSSTASELIVETTLRALVELCSKNTNEQPLTKDEIRESLNRMADFLKILKDHRVKSQGSEDWHFTLILWSTQIDENVQKFGQTWEANRPPKSKKDITQPPPPPVGLERTVRVYRPLQMPPLPDYFVARPEHEQAVKSLLLAPDNTTPGTLVVSAIYGLGGIGKSVLAAALAHCSDVQDRFADGILWATLGQEPDLLSFLSGWIQALGDRDYKPTSVDAASMHLRSLLYNKRVLLVVDDAWNPDHVEAFRIGGTGCRVLVTTREAEVSGAKRYDWRK
jgi:hypothetical protein